MAGKVRRVFDLLDGHFGALHWWPGESPFEIIVGAILTQNTAWRNVEHAIANLRSAGLLSPEGIRGADDDTLAGLIRPSGYYHIKTRRLQAFIRFLYGEFGGRLDRMFALEVSPLRQRLLLVKGIGEETADSILLYAGNKPIFVVDAYTRRILARHGMIPVDADYGQVQSLFMEHLPRDAALYNQYHALLVNTGKDFCRKTPRCETCPLRVLEAGKGKGGLPRGARNRPGHSRECFT